MAYFGFGRSFRHRNYSKELTPVGRIFMALISAAFIIMPFVEFDRYKGLAENGKQAEATVISYNPTYTHSSKGGITTHHWHVLAFDGAQHRVEMKRQLIPGTKLSIVYDPARPSFVAEGKKGMSGAELMGSGYGMMWGLVGMGIFMIFIAVFAPSKPGAQAWYKAGQAPEQAPESFVSNKQAAPDFIPAASTTAAFAPGGPQAHDKQPGQGSMFSRFGFDVMDEGYRLFKDNKEMAAAALAEKFGHLTVGQAKEVIAKADALDYAAEDEANNVQGGLYTAEKAAANLMKTNPGFSEGLYKQIIQDKVRG